MRRTYRYLIMFVVLAVLLAFLIWPIVLTVQGAFGSAEGQTPGERVGGVLKYFIGDVGVLRDPRYVQGLFNSLRIASATTLLCLLMTLPMAVLATRYNFPGKAALTGIVLVPLILPPFVGAIGMRAILGRFGALNAAIEDVGAGGPVSVDFLGASAGGRFWGVVVMEALHLYPILYLNLSAALANLDPTLEEAALNLGAGRWRRFWRITFPLILPGVFAGSTIVFIWSFTELGTPLMFDYYAVTPVQIFTGIQEVASSPRPYALVVVMLVMSVLLYALAKISFGGRGYEMYSKASVASAPRKLRGLRGWSAMGLFAGVTLLAVLPHIGVIFSAISEDGTWYRSVLPTRYTGDHFVQALSHPLAIGSIRNSLVFASLAMILCVILGMTIAHLNVRAKLRGAWVLDSLAMLPLAVPGLVMAFGYVAMTLRWPFAPMGAGAAGWWQGWLPGGVGEWLAGGPLSFVSVVGAAPNPVPLLVIAYAVRRLPYVVRSVSAGLEQTPVMLEEAAINLGATPMMTLRKIVVPLIMANLIAGGILAFAFAMLEVSDSLILAQKETHYPITKAIFELYNRLGDGPYIASAMGVWGMALLSVTLVGAGMLLGKRLGAIFRV